MRNVGWYVLDILAVALGQPGSAHLIPFKHTLRCVQALVNYNMLAQYRSHTVETIIYMKVYLDKFHKIKDIFLEFGGTKRIHKKLDEQRSKL